ncbi:MAG: dolichyl-phosphate-mannose--protein mannosyltransferase, partial [Oscillospiraceae bacterium]|nr:dolichyl-phosphate-mannose--protein mannosyltransferase [Oscillospiraceae bacterium]
MRYIKPPILFALAVLGCIIYFLMRYFMALHNRPTDLLWVKGERKPLRFAGSCHRIGKKDRIILLLITLLYACTAFFRLGSLSAPQATVDFGSGDTLLVRVKGEPFLAAGIRYFSGLGTGGYNVEISSDGDHWSTLWQRKEDPNDAKKVTGYYWADAEGYSPNYALTQNYNQLFKWIDVTVSTPQYVQYLRITGKS